MLTLPYSLPQTALFHFCAAITRHLPDQLGTSHHAVKTLDKRSEGHAHCHLRHSVDVHTSELYRAPVWISPSLASVRATLLCLRRARFSLAARLEEGCLGTAWFFTHTHKHINVDVCGVGTWNDSWDIQNELLWLRCLTDIGTRVWFLETHQFSDLTLQV